MEPRLRVDIPLLTPDAAFIDRLAAVAASAPPAPAATVGPRRVLALAVAAGSVAAIVAGVAYAAHDRSDGLPPTHPTPVVRPSHPIPTPTPRPPHPGGGRSGNAPAPGTEAPVTTGVAAASTGNDVHGRTTGPTTATTHEPAESDDGGTETTDGTDDTTDGDSPTRSGSDDTSDGSSDDASDSPTPDPTGSATDGGSDPSSPDATPEPDPSATATPTSNG